MNNLPLSTVLLNEIIIIVDVFSSLYLEVMNCSMYQMYQSFFLAHLGVENKLN